MIKILFNPKRAERHPFEMFLIGLFYSSLSIILSLWVFPEHASLFMVFFTVISCIYIVQGAIKREESKDLDYKSEKWVLKSHIKTLKFFLALFLGFVFSFTLWAFLLPQIQSEIPIFLVWPIIWTEVLQEMVVVP